jgi:hypothetical protein
VSTNPFEPPRTSDLEGGSGPGELVFSEAALHELAASAPRVRWFARITAVSMAIGIVEGAVALFGPRATGGAITLLNIMIGTSISIAFLAVLRRYAVAAERLRAGTRQAAVDVVFAQSSYFKLLGVMTIVGIALVLLLLVIAVAAGALSGGRT